VGSLAARADDAKVKNAVVDLQDASDSSVQLGKSGTNVVETVHKDAVARLHTERLKTRYELFYVTAKSTKRQGPRRV